MSLHDILFSIHEQLGDHVLDPSSMPTGEHAAFFTPFGDQTSVSVDGVHQADIGHFAGYTTLSDATGHQELSAHAFGDGTIITDDMGEQVAQVHHLGNQDIVTSPTGDIEQTINHVGSMDIHHAADGEIVGVSHQFGDGHMYTDHLPGGGLHHSADSFLAHDIDGMDGNSIANYLQSQTFPFPFS
ncbi:hypothetical protein [Salinisphaera hydrothermalis]|uniref:hypothetical protein n=1 Tax=Salinisphaera hydrothermalis TaxID=563188 RepID=UPI00333EA7CA